MAPLLLCSVYILMLICTFTWAAQNFVNVTDCPKMGIKIKDEELLGLYARLYLCAAIEKKCFAKHTWPLTQSLRFCWVCRLFLSITHGLVKTKRAITSYIPLHFLLRTVIKATSRWTCGVLFPAIHSEVHLVCVLPVKSACFFSVNCDPFDD